MDDGPLQNDTFIRNCIASGALTPPHNDIARNDRLTQIWVFGCLIMGGFFFWLGMGFK